MFTVFIDDSGTAPDQSVAIASALIIPSAKLLELEEDWTRFKKLRNFSSFHTSACVAASAKEGFGNWTQTQIERTIGGVRMMVRRYGAQIVSFAVKKDDYDQVVPQKMRRLGGQYHYTWAIRHTLDFVNHWARSVGYTDPFLYIFDWIDPKSAKKPKAEIETVMAQMESDHPGFYEGKYDFKKSEDYPALQCVDLVAWACYGMARSVMCHKPIPRLASRVYWNLYNRQTNKDWFFAAAMTRTDLEKWAATHSSDDEKNTIREKWLIDYQSRRKSKPHP